MVYRRGSTRPVSEAPGESEKPGGRGFSLWSHMRNMQYKTIEEGPKYYELDILIGVDCLSPERRRKYLLRQNAMVFHNQIKPWIHM
jgi:hypothetical protein